jgi:hypothetical protein
VRPLIHSLQSGRHAKWSGPHGKASEVEMALWRSTMNDGASYRVYRCNGGLGGRAHEVRI